MHMSDGIGSACNNLTKYKTLVETIKFKLSNNEINEIQIDTKIIKYK